MNKKYLFATIAIVAVVIIITVFAISKANKHENNNLITDNVENNNNEIENNNNEIESNNNETENENQTDIEETNEDYKICTADYRPVCGVDGITYGNACMARDIEILHDGECEVSNLEGEQLACTLDYRPVCGADGVTYGNSCSAGSTEIAYEGECAFEDDIRVKTCENHGGEIETRDSEKYNNYYVCVFEDNSECEAFKLINGKCYPGDYIFETRPCTKDFKPVCGINGVTYANPCIAGDIPIEKEGEC